MKMKYFCLKGGVQTKYYSEIPSDCQTVWIQIRPYISLGLILVQTASKGYQQATKVGKQLKSFVFKKSDVPVVFVCKN